MNNRRQVQKKKAAGFTLVELIAVIVILGILAAVIVPKYLDVTDEAKDASYKAALSEGISRITQAFSKYIITQGDNPEHANWATLKGADYLNGGDGTLLSIGDFQLDFTSDGTTPAPNGGITALLKDTGGNQIVWQSNNYGTLGANITVTVPYPD